MPPRFVLNALTLAVATAVRREKKAYRHNRIGRGVRNTRWSKTVKFYDAGFCSGKQERERRAAL